MCSHFLILKKLQRCPIELAYHSLCFAWLVFECHFNTTGSQAAFSCTGRSKMSQLQISGRYVQGADRPRWNEQHQITDDDIQAQSFRPGPECRKTWAWNVKLKIIYFTNDGASSVYFVSLHTLLYFKNTDVSRENSVKPPQQKLDASYSSALEKRGKITVEERVLHLMKMIVSFSFAISQDSL